MARLPLLQESSHKILFKRLTCELVVPAMGFLAHPTRERSNCASDVGSFT